MKKTPEVVASAPRAGRFTTWALAALSPLFAFTACDEVEDVGDEIQDVGEEIGDEIEEIGGGD